MTICELKPLQNSWNIKLHHYIDVDILDYAYLTISVGRCNLCKYCIGAWHSCCASLFCDRWVRSSVLKSKSVHCYCFKIWYCQLFVRRQSCHWCCVNTSVVCFLYFSILCCILCVQYARSCAAYMDIIKDDNDDYDFLLKESSMSEIRFHLKK